jgi:hypothetical protein
MAPSPDRVSGQAGFDFRAGNDVDSFAGATFARTRRATEFLPEPVVDITTARGSSRST